MTDEIEQIKKTISVLETQRTVLGDAVVDTALAPLREKLASLQPQPGAEQRKLVTVLFADLVGFTPLSENMDPEDLGEIMSAYYTRWSASIEKFGGIVEKFIGDAAVAVFGLTVAREDEPENAIRAALDMRQALAGLNEELQPARGLNLAMRTGIHTGLAMVSLSVDDPSSKDFVILGDTVNVASRLQAAAPEGGILISHETYRHVRGIFDIQAQGEIQVKGRQEPLQGYLVLRAKERTFYSPSRGVEGIETRMIGRDAELQQLKDALSLAMEQTRTQVISISGEAGIGKSRLILEFANWLELLPEVVRFFKVRVSPAMENMPYSLFREMLAFRFQIQDSDPPQMVQAKLEAGFGEFGYPDLQQRVLYIGHLLGYRFSGSAVLESAARDPLVLRETVLAYLVEYFKNVAAIRTVVLMLEDIHWADDSSLDFLEQLLARLPDQPLLLIGTTRPMLFERRPEWEKQVSWGKASTANINLQPLTPVESQGLIQDILQKVDQIPESLHAFIAEHAEGNPFFIEEFIKLLIEDGIILKENEHWHVNLAKLADVTIPTTLVEVLQARSDSLSLEERVLLQRASVIGRTFWDNAVGSMEAAQEDQILLAPRMDHILSALSSREMIFPSDSSAFESNREFVFKHALLRDVTYESVLKRLRKVYHVYAASWLEAVTQQSGRSDEYAALIADHYDHAEDVEKARQWYLTAGDLAKERYANAEGIRCLSRCLELTPKEDLSGLYELLLKRAGLYDTLADRQSQKRDLESLQGVAEQLDQSTSAEKAPEDGEMKSHRAAAHMQWWHYYDALGDYQASMAMAQQVIALSQKAGDADAEARGYMFLGATMWRRSEYPQAQEHLEKSLSLARQAHDREIEGDVLRNLGIIHQFQANYAEARRHYEASMLIYREIGNEKGESMALNSLGVLLSELGRLQEARTYLEQSLELKRKIGHRRAVNTTLHNLGFIAYRMGRYGDAAQRFSQVLEYAIEAGDLEAQADAYFSLGSVSTHLGSYATAQEQLEKAMLTYRQIDEKNGVCITYIQQAILAEHRGDRASALALSQEALVLARELNLKRELAGAFTYAGNFLLSVARIEEASEHLQEAQELWQELGDLRILAEVRAACAHACLAGGNKAEALAQVEQVLECLTGQAQASTGDIQEMTFSSLEGMVEPFAALLHCCIVLKAIGDPRAKPLGESACRLLYEQASWIEDEGLRKSFLENVPANKEITSRCNQRDG